MTGLFFLIITFQKSRSLVLLRAIGAGTGVPPSLLVQVLFVVGVGVAIGTLLYLALSRAPDRRDRRCGSTPRRSTWAALFLVLAPARHRSLAAAGCCASTRSKPPPRGGR